MSLLTTPQASVGHAPFNRQKMDQPDTLQDAVQRALSRYFQQLDGTPPTDLYQMVMKQVEQPLFTAVMQHTGGNQSKAAGLLGISRSTLRKKLAQYEIE